MSWNLSENLDELRGNTTDYRYSDIKDENKRWFLKGYAAAIDDIEHYDTDVPCLISKKLDEVVEEIRKATIEELQEIMLINISEYLTAILDEEIE